jgi:hypothetical protein
MAALYRLTAVRSIRSARNPAHTRPYGRRNSAVRNGIKDGFGADEGKKNREDQKETERNAAAFFKLGQNAARDPEPLKALKR